MSTNPPDGYPPPPEQQNNPSWDPYAGSGSGPEPTRQLNFGPPPPEQPWWMQRWFGIASLAVGAVIILALIGALFGEDDSEPAASTTTTDPSPTATVTVTATPTPSPGPAEETGAPAEAEAENEASKKAGEKAADEPADAWTMPDEVGKNLQAAQDHIQGVTDDPFFVTLSEDATGEGRFQVLDSNWQVCSQSVAPGEKFSANTEITFYTVKLSETCP
ncbi:PASTA domain-containing protein [Nocardioides faecalis]|uniref:PASTA domain-containing protein n=1 Tax=Nocardioides faecalis TaxID=2803858 RepID=UPI001BCB8716|nr:PASTA domain-containing protein [Nocardioides faecalis]QVI58455.1 hypothetical protein KG111_15900 [Nocardioides faecalis]